MPSIKYKKKTYAGATFPVLEMTKAEYDALSEAKKMDGTVYMITDDTGGWEAENASYDNTDSGLTATNVQDALDEICNTTLMPTWYTDYEFVTYSETDAGASGVYILGKLCIFSLSFIYNTDRTPQAIERIVQKMPKPRHDMILLGSAHTGTAFIPSRFRITADIINAGYGMITSFYGLTKTYANCPTIVTGCYMIA